MNKTYICIDLKSFYASVECVEKNLDPLTTNLVVADSSRTDKTICLAVSPSLKSYGIGGRCRLFELKQVLKKINYERKKNNKFKEFIGKSFNDIDLKNNKLLEIDYLVAPPRMAHYIKYSSMIYNIYLKFISEEDIFVYSIDEVFCDITNYLNLYKSTPKELVTKIIKEVYDVTGITATAGIGTNLYLAKIAMDIVAKKAMPNEFGVRIAELDEMSYRKLLWSHTPLTDFWRVGKGISNKLEKIKIRTMGDLARCSLVNEDLLYKIFGVNAELLIDHAWGYEPCTIESVKSYKPSTTSLSSGQVLHEPTKINDAIIVLKEMADSLGLELVSKHLVTNQIVLTITYDIDNLKNGYISSKYDGEIVIDNYNREVPKPSHGTYNLEYETSSSTILMESFLKLFNKIVNPILLIRKINISVNNLVSEKGVKDKVRSVQMDLFSDEEAINKLEYIKEKENEEKEIQKTILEIKNKYGKNSILKAMNLLESSTAIERNKQIGGHHE